MHKIEMNTEQEIRNRLTCGAAGLRSMRNRAVLLVAGDREMAEEFDGEEELKLRHLWSIGDEARSINEEVKMKLGNARYHLT